MSFTLRLRTRWFIGMGALLVLFAVGCDPLQAVTFDNQAPIDVKLDIRTVPLDYSGNPRLNWNDPGVIINAFQSKTIAGVRKTREGGGRYKYSVIAVTETNEVVFFKIFTWDELHDMNWTVVIPTPQNK